MSQPVVLVFATVLTRKNVNQGLQHITSASTVAGSVSGQLLSTTSLQAPQLKQQLAQPHDEELQGLPKSALQFRLHEKRQRKRSLVRQLDQEHHDQVQNEQERRQQQQQYQHKRLKDQLLQEGKQQAEQHALQEQQVLQRQAATLREQQLNTELAKQQDILKMLSLNPADEEEHGKQTTSLTAAFSMLCNQSALADESQVCSVHAFALCAPYCQAGHHLHCACRCYSKKLSNVRSLFIIANHNSCTLLVYFHFPHFLLF